MTNNASILKRLYIDYSKKFLLKILLSGLFAIFVAASTSCIAWLLDPAIKKIFIEKDQSLILFIPILIIIAFAVKGVSLYIAKVTMISVGEEVRKILQVDMLNSIIKADTELIDKKHSGKFISNLNFDTMHITNLLSTAILNLFKDGLTLIALLSVMFYQNWKLSLISIIMIQAFVHVGVNLKVLPTTGMTLPYLSYGGSSIISISIISGIILNLTKRRVY